MSIKYPNRNRPRQLKKGVRILANGIVQRWVKPFGSRKGYWSPRARDLTPRG